MPAGGRGSEVGAGEGRVHEGGYGYDGGDRADLYRGGRAVRDSSARDSLGPLQEASETVPCTDDGRRLCLLCLFTII